MKKKSIITGLVVICIAMSLSACGSQKKEAEVVPFEEIAPPETEPVILRAETPETTEEDSLETEETTEEAIVSFCDRNVVAYQLTEAQFEQGNIKILYPQITDMADSALMEKMNENIRATVIPEEVLQDEAVLAYEVTYEIATQGTGILSIVFRGYQNYTGVAYPSRFCKTLNLDLTNGDNVRLKEYGDVERIVSCLELNQGYHVLSGIDQNDFSAYLNNGYVTDYAITLLDYDLDFSGELTVSGYSYIKDNQPVLCIEAEHVMGDYVEVCFDMQIASE